LTKLLDTLTWNRSIRNQRLSFRSFDADCSEKKTKTDIIQINLNFKHRGLNSETGSICTNLPYRCHLNPPRAHYQGSCPSISSRLLRGRLCDRNHHDTARRLVPGGIRCRQSREGASSRWNAAVTGCQTKYRWSAIAFLTSRLRSPHRRKVSTLFLIISNDHSIVVAGWPAVRFSRGSRLCRRRIFYFDLHATMHTWAYSSARTAIDWWGEHVSRAYFLPHA